jgi:type III restriction enzyme
VVSDFGLVEAIESGIVKIPRVPVDDNATTPNVQFLNLWPGIKDGLPKKGRKQGMVTPDQMPGLLEGALNALYDSYVRAFDAWETSDAKKYGEPAPSSSSSAATPPSPRWSTTTSPAGRSRSATTRTSGCPAS